VGRGTARLERGFTAAAASLSGVYASRAACTAPPASDGKKKTVPKGHAKPSSYAPQPRPPNRAYGVPIQRPILSKHKRPKHRTGHSTSQKNRPPEGPMINRADQVSIRTRSSRRG